MKKDSEVLREAIELIRDPKSWIKGEWCTFDDNGRDVFCAEGAIFAANGLWYKQTHNGRVRWGDNINHIMFSGGAKDDISPEEYESNPLRVQGERIFAQMVEAGREMYPDRHRVFPPEDDSGLAEPVTYYPRTVNEYNDAYLDHGEVVALMEKTATAIEEKGD